MMEQISDHFSMSEFTFSPTAVEHSLRNEPDRIQRSCIRSLVINLLEPLRRYAGEPIRITSGFRSEALNRLVGGVKTSQHRLGEAADCFTPKGPRFLLRRLLDSGLPFDQAIVYQSKNFIHLSYREGRNRRMIIIRS